VPGLTRPIAGATSTNLPITPITPVIPARAVVGGARFPPLILVTTGPGGGLVVLEGHARLTAFMLARDRLPPELEVLTGPRRR